MSHLTKDEYYIDDFTHFYIVFGKYKRAIVYREDVVDMIFHHITRTLKYNGITDTFLYLYEVSKFMIEYRGDKSDVKNLECRAIQFYNGEHHIGNLEIKSAIIPKVQNGYIVLQTNKIE